MQLSHLIKIEIVCNDLPLVQLGEFDQLQVYFADSRKVVFHNLDINRGDFLEALQNIQPSTSTITLERIGGVGDQLQLAQNKLRDHQDAIQEPGFGNIGDAAVDNYAGVENLVALFR